MPKLLLCCVLATITAAMAAVPDTTFIEANADPTKNVGIIKAIIEADVNPDGSHKDMVYVLERGGTYPFSERVNTKGGYLEILGKTEPANLPPAFLTGWLKPDASGQNREFFWHAGDITIKNIAYTTAGADNEPSASGALLSCTSDSNTVVLQHIYGDYCGSIYTGGGGSYLSIFMDDIFFRNSQTLCNGGNKIHKVVSVTNMTSFDSWNPASLVGGGNGLLLDSLYMDHQTLVFSPWGPFQWHAHSNTIFRNSVTYDAMMRGDTYNALKNRPTDCEGKPHQDCVIQWDKIDSTGLARLGITQNERRIELTNLDIFNSPAHVAFYDAQDSMVIAEAIRPRMLCDYIESGNYPLMTMSNFIEEDPQFKQMPHEMDVHFAKILEIRGQPPGPAVNRYFHDFDGDGSPLTLAWPHTVGMDLTVQNPKLVNSGTDGLNWGDLAHWGAPGQYEQWLQLHKGEFPTTTKVSNAHNTAPLNFELAQNYPNPFNPQTTIAFKVLQPAKVNLSVYSVMGQKVKTLVNERLAIGSHQVQWNGLDESGHKVASGVYYYKIETEGFSLSMKMLMLK